MRQRLWRSRRARLVAGVDPEQSAGVGLDVDGGQDADPLLSQRGGDGTDGLLMVEIDLDGVSDLHGVPGSSPKRSSVPRVAPDHYNVPPRGMLTCVRWSMAVMP